jgi:peptidoglycan/LPS O-acetylase OafA/YrhL
MSRNIPSLDGLRAVSIGMVIVGHLFHRKVNEFRGVERIVSRMIANADLGVSIFFVISGFLITTLLLMELRDRARIDLRRFYIRRSFRIFPAFYVYLLALLLLGLAGMVTIVPKTWMSAALYLRNYWPPLEGSGDWITAHTWSLAVEEQFYLLWPLAFTVLGRRRSTFLAAALIVLFPISRVATYWAFPAARPDLGYMLHTRGDGLMMGCLLALVVDQPWCRRLRERLYDWHAPALAIVFLLIGSNVLHLRFGGWYLLPAGYTAEAFAVVLVLAWLVDRPTTALGRILNHPAVKHVGVISYSLYLWQQLFAAWHGWWRVPAIFLAAEASYRLVERPCLRLRDRVMRKGRPSTHVDHDLLRERSSDALA